MEKIFLLIQESNVDGEILINVTPCATIEIARKLMKQEVFTLLNESIHYSGFSDSKLKGYFIIEETKDYYFIKDKNDDYYEYLKIDEKEIVKKI